MYVGHVTMLGRSNQEVGLEPVRGRDIRDTKIGVAYLIGTGLASLLTRSLLSPRCLQRYRINTTMISAMSMPIEEEQ